MNISKKAEYAVKAVIIIARHNQSKPLQISEISQEESIPIKFLEQILLNLKNNGILKSKRGVNGGYLLAKSCKDISVGTILDIIDGRFDPIGLQTGNHLGKGLDKCFGDMIEMVNEHLQNFTIHEVLEIEKPKDLLAFEI